MRAQQCGYDHYYLFVVNLDYSEINLRIKAPKIYLVDEKNQPVTAEVRYLEDKKWKHRNDTLFFWKNSKAPTKEGERPLLYRKFYHIGDYYVVAFYMNQKQLKDPLHYPVYKLKMEFDRSDLMTDGLSEEPIYLPIQKAVRVCNNGILENFNLNKPVETLDGNPFEPIQIKIKKEELVSGGNPIVESAELRYSVRFEFKTMTSKEQNETKYLLNKAYIYDLQSGKMHQEINIPRVPLSYQKNTENIVRFEDFRNRGLTAAKDFSVLIDSWHDTINKAFRTKTNYYLFNPKNQLYELDTAFSNYTDVTYEPAQKRFKRITVETKNAIRIINTYYYEDSTWVLKDRNETNLAPIIPKTTYTSKICIQIPEIHKTTKLQAAVDAVKMVSDTIWLYNVCDDTITIQKVESAYRDFINVNQTLLPKQRTPFVLNYPLQPSSYDFTTENINCVLKLDDGFAFGIGFMIPVVSNHVKVYYRNDGSVDYAIAQKPNKHYSRAIFTYSDGSIRAVGTIVESDTNQRMGNWKYFSNNKSITKEDNFTKQVALSAISYSGDSRHNNFKIKLWVNDAWQYPFVDRDGSEAKFHIIPGTDSICAYTDFTSYTFPVNYQKLPNYIQKDIFLLKPGESHLKIGYIDMPFKLYKDLFTIIPNPNANSRKDKTSEEISALIIDQLIKQYPGISKVIIYHYQYGFSLESLTPQLRQQVIRKLYNDTNVLFICQLFTLGHSDKMMFCNNIVSAEIDLKEDQEFRRSARKLGFENAEIDDGNNKFNLTYGSKLIDADFFETYKKLTKHPKVRGAHLRIYMQMDLDWKN